MDNQQTLVLRELFSKTKLNALPWTAFRDGVEIYRLYDGPDGASAALLRYRPGAKIPHHRHTGYEHIFILDGAQRDEHGEYAPGTLIVSAKGSQHSVSSEQGCIVLAIWQAPVNFT